MHGQRRLGIIIGLLLALIAAVPALAQEGEPSCTEGANGQPAVQVSQVGQSDFVVAGCNFRAGEAVRIGARLKQGDANWVQLSAVQAHADADGAFEATISGPADGLDFASGYQIEVIAEGANGSSAQTGMAAIAGGGMPPQDLPETGGGGASGGTPWVYLLTTVTVLVATLGGIGARRLIAR